MAKLPLITIQIKDPSSKEGRIISFKSETSVNTDGVFSCSIPEYLLDCVSALASKHQVFVVKNKINYVVKHDNLEHLKNFLNESLKNYCKPKIVEEIVILYNIQTHVSFVENGDDIFPNGSFDGANYDGNDKTKESGNWCKGAFYGDHHAAHKAQEGYSIIVGAKVCKKITTYFDDNKRVDFEHYNHGKGTPSHLLNSWGSFDLKKPKEIPYSDDAATFFYNMMMGMAKLAKSMNEYFSNEQKLIKSIEQYKEGQNLLGLLK